MRLQVLGSGDAFGSGGRLNTCFHVTSSQPSLLIDCGASAMIAIRRFAVDPNDIRTVLITHLHGDHFAGLPFFILDAQIYSKRRKPLTIAGPPGTRERLQRTMEALFPGSSQVARKFDLEIVELPSDVRTVVNGIAVRPFEVNHDSGAPAYALRIEADGRTIAYTGDTDWVDSLLEAGREADLLIAEALFYDKQVRYHLDYCTLERHLPSIGARRVLVTHMGPDMLARTGDLACEAAHDGKVIEL